MNQETIRSQRIGEEYFKVNHPSGLTLLLYPMAGFSTTFAMFSTKYGSVDTRFGIGDEPAAAVPAGIAHYLEHKLFESEDGDAFARYAKTGANANAFTTFDKTSYLFSCSDNFRESLEILLDFVTHPYFTKESVEKEQGIIGQEIRMCDDDPNWKVMFNLLGCLYKNNPVKIDIAGTVESIAEIDADLLYRCYNTFYNLNNMVLSVVGNFKVEDVYEIADKVLKQAEPFRAQVETLPEPIEVSQKRIVCNLPVATPIFEIGFKSPDHGETQNFKSMVLDEMIVDIVAGETTPLYKELYNEGLINDGLGGESMAGRDYLCTTFTGESKDPDKVYQRICEELSRLQKEGIGKEIFDRVKKATYGRYVGMFSKQEAICSVLTSTYLSGMPLYDLLETVASVTEGELAVRLIEDFNPEYSAISIVQAGEE